MSYADVIRAFIRDKGITSVVDLGCGDFRVGSMLQIQGVKYIGVDIVSDLIDSNQDKYGNADTSLSAWI